MVCETVDVKCPIPRGVSSRSRARSQHFEAVAEVSADSLGGHTPQQRRAPLAGSGVSLLSPPLSNCSGGLWRGRPAQVEKAFPEEGSESDFE